MPSLGELVAELETPTLPTWCFVRKGYWQWLIDSTAERGGGVVGSNYPGPGRNKEAQKKLKGPVGRKVQIKCRFFITGIKK